MIVLVLLYLLLVLVYKTRAKQPRVCNSRLSLAVFSRTPGGFSVFMAYNGGNLCSDWSLTGVGFTTLDQKALFVF